MSENQRGCERIDKKKEKEVKRDEIFCGWPDKILYNREHL